MCVSDCELGIGRILIIVCVKSSSLLFCCLFVCGLSFASVFIINGTYALTLIVIYAHCFPLLNGTESLPAFYDQNKSSLMQSVMRGELPSQPQISY